MAKKNYYKMAALFKGQPPIIFLMRNIIFLFIIFLSSCNVTGSSKLDSNTTPQKINQNREDKDLNQNLIELNGIVEKVYKFKGTLSEYSYFVIQNKEETIIFNEKMSSQGFDEYLGKRVEIRGKKITGYIGWRKTPANGIMVLNISEKTE